MAWKRKPSLDMGDSEVEMTPMIDVVFQLLIYFIVTIQPVDVTAHLDVLRPAGQTAREQQDTPPKMIRIQIYQGALLMNDRSVDMPTMARLLNRLGEISTSQTVVISCARDSKHERLVEVLNHCAKAGLNNLSVTTMN